MDRFNIRQKLSALMVRGRRCEDVLPISGYYPVIEHIRDGNVIATYEVKNGITNIGKNTLFDVMFNAASQTAAANWVISLINNAGYTALAATDTMASHPGWTEWTGYTQANRVAWGQGASAGQTVTNGTPAVFDLNADGAVIGIFVCNNNTKGGSTGILWAHGTFNASVPVTTGDQLKITYAVAA